MNEEAKATTLTASVLRYCLLISSRQIFETNYFIFYRILIVDVVFGLRVWLLGRLIILSSIGRVRVLRSVRVSLVACFTVMLIEFSNCICGLNSIEKSSFESRVRLAQPFKGDENEFEKFD